MGNFLTSWAFWLLIISIILFVIFFIFYEKYGTAKTGEKTPSWLWWVLSFALTFFLISAVNYILQINNERILTGIPNKESRIEKAVAGYYSEGV